MSGIHSFKVKKKKQNRSECTEQVSNGLGTWEGNLIIEGVPALASRKGGI